MNFDELNDSNFVMYAMKHYENPQFTGIEEFHEDLNRIKYIKRLLRKYHKTNELRERLILNHLIIMNNVFDCEPMCRLLFHKIDDELQPQLKTFLVYLNFLPKNVPNINIEEIPLDPRIVETLRGL